MSRSGETYQQDIYQQGDISQYTDDDEIIEHFAPGDCTDQTEIPVEFDG